MKVGAKRLRPKRREGDQVKAEVNVKWVHLDLRSIGLVVKNGSKIRLCTSFDMPDSLGVCPSNPSLRGKGVAGRCKAAGAKKPEA
jgi:hypothetical protein